MNRFYNQVAENSNHFAEEMIYNLVVMETFGQWLKRCRKESGLTQAELHQKSGVSASYISTLEREQPHSITGSQLRPEPDKVEKLAKALGQSVDDALQLAGYAPTTTNDPVPKTVIAAFAREGELSKNDEELIVNFIDMLKRQKKESQ